MSDIDEALAQILESYPVIWNRSLAIFRDIKKKENAFKEIARFLNVTVDMVVGRYKALREKYRKEKAKIKLATRSGAGQLSFEPWHLMETLRFFDAVQKTRKTASNAVFGNSCSYDERRADYEDTAYDGSYGTVEYLEDAGEDDPLSIGTYDLSNGEIEVDAPSLPQKRLHTQTVSAALFSPTLSTNSSCSSGLGSAANKSKRDPIEGMMEKLVSAAEAASQISIQPPTVPLNKFEHFGMYVSQSLIHMSPNNANSAMFKISEIIFKYNTEDN